MELRNTMNELKNEIALISDQPEEKNLSQKIRTLKFYSLRRIKKIE